MAEPLDRAKLEALADGKVGDILRAAASWAKEVPPALTPAIRAVCVRLAEMVADQRHYLAPLPEPQESERRAVLTLIADRLRTGPIAKELRATGSWSPVEGAQQEWVQTAIDYLDRQTLAVDAERRPDEYWADDVV